jgi:nicotinate-nucleotide adenylyltransferase
VKLGLFGGSFDPIHCGHVLPVQAARQVLGLDEVLYLPTAHPPHKARRKLAPPHARYAMVEMTLLDEEGLSVSPYELTLDRPAYTAETLEHFRSVSPEADLHLLIGSDSFSDLHHWVRGLEIPRLARVVVLARPGWSVGDGGESSLPPELRELAQGDRVVFLHQPPIDVSATRLREMFARGEQPPAGQVHPSVVRYVQKYNLYT